MKWDVSSSLTFAKSLANQDNIRVQVNDNYGETFRPYSQNGTIHLSPPTPENMAVYEPELHRCISHNFKEVAFTQAAQYEDGSRSQITHRLLTDYIAEKAKHGEYPGRDEILSEHRSSTMTGFDVDSIGDDKLEQLMHTLTRARNDWQSYVHDDVESSLEKQGFKQLLNQCKTEADLRKLVQLVETVEQEQEDQQQGDGDDGDDGTDDSGSSEAGSDDGQDGEDEDDGSEGEGNEDSDGDNSGDSGEGSGSGEDESGPSNESSKGSGGSGEGEGGGDSGDSDDDGDGQEAKEHGVGFNAQKALEAANILGQSNQVVKEYEDYKGEYVPRDIHNNTEERKPSESTWGDATEELDKLLDSLRLSKKVKRHLLSMRQVGYEYGLKTGKLNNKAISRVYTSKGVQPRIFKQKNSSRLEVETAVSILCDCSGSMSGRKFKYAAASCIATSLILQDLKINHEIIGFSTSGHDNIYYQFKRYNESNVSREVLVKRFLSSNVGMGCNSDGEALTYCMEHLLNRQEKNKVLLVLSDGSPAGSGYGDSYAYLKRICASIEEDGMVNLAAIGIMTECVKEFYSNYQVIKRPEDLEPAILELMSKNIIR